MADETQLPFLKHIEELRKRLIRIVIGIALATCATLSFVQELFSLLIEPARNVIAEQSFVFIGTAPADAFMAKLKVGLLAGFLLSLPWTFYQLWRFIEPGMHDNEKKLSGPFIAAGTAFFLAGVSFCYVVVFPIAFKFFLAEFQSIGVEAHLRLDEYFAFVTSMLLVFGIVFELPVFSYILTRLGFIDHHWLIKRARGAVVTIFILAAILTPPDVMSQMCLAVPMLVLYLLCIGVAYSTRRSKSDRANPETMPARPPDLISPSSSIPRPSDSSQA